MDSNRPFAENFSDHQEIQNKVEYRMNLSHSGSFVNGTGSGSLDGLDDDLSLNYFALVTVIFPLATVVGNWAVILSVKREKSLQTSTNFLIVSLAVADLLVGLIVMPWGIYALVSNQWYLPYIICDVYMAADVICSTASIFNLVAISVDRYRAIMQPMEYSQSQTTGRGHRIACGYISAAWGIAIAVGMPILFGLNETPDRHRHPHERTCEFHNPDFIIGSSVLSFYIPCVIIVALYFKIMKMILTKEQKLKAAKQYSNPLKDSVRSTHKAAPAKKVFEPPSPTTFVISTPKCVTPVPPEGQPDAKSPRNETAEKVEDNNKTVDRDEQDDDEPKEKLKPESVDLEPEPAQPDICLDAKEEVSVNSNSINRDEEEEVFVTKKHSSPACQLPCKVQKSVSTQADLKRAGSPNEKKSAKRLTVSFKHTVPVSNGTSPPATPVSKIKARLVRMRSSSSTWSMESEKGGNGAISPTGRTSVKSLGLAASAKLLTKAANWKAKSMERIQAKNERRERRATKTLAIVLGCFLVCWIPFFTCNIIAAIAIKFDLKSLKPSMGTFLVTTWLGYVNSVLNPFIYTIFNREFRKAFEKIFKKLWTNESKEAGSAPASRPASAKRKEEAKKEAAPVGTHV